MAIRTIRETGAGFIPEPQPWDAERVVTGQHFASLWGKVREIVRAINGNLSFGDGTVNGRLGNFAGQRVKVRFPATPDTPIAIDHGLDRVPVGYRRVRADRAVDVYDAQTGSWGKTTFYLQASVADALVELEVY